MTVPLFDGHCDTAFRMLLHSCGLRENDGHNDLTRALRYAPYAQFFAVFAIDENDMPVDFPHLKGKSGPELFELELQLLLKELEANKDLASLCRNARDAENAAHEGKAAAFISVEGAELIGCSIEGLERVHALGVRAVNITWNYPNSLSGTNAEDTKRGLSPLGRGFVRRCNELGVIVDVSHLSDPGFWDVLETSTAPIMASHSNARALCPHRRNLTDEQFVALIKNGGIAGLNLYTDFLGPEADIGTAVGHLEHFLALGGERSLSIGCDLDGCDSLAAGVSGVQDLGKLYDALLKKNLPESLVRDIFYNNLMRVVSQVCVI